MRIVAIIQARMGSTRLPGKVLLPLAGKPMLQNIVERVARAKLLDDIIVACPYMCWSKLPMPHGAHLSSILAVAEDDLVGRYYETAKLNKADYVVRIPGDNPMVDPDAIDLLIGYALALQPKGVLFTNAGDLPGSQWPDGIGAEFYSMKMLEWMNATVKAPAWREHPHKYWHETGYAEEPPVAVVWNRPDVRLDVNTQEDYERIKAVYDHFGNNEFRTVDVLNYLDAKDLEKRPILT